MKKADHKTENGLSKSNQLPPMLKQYFEIKGRHENFILFFRVGDFYEMFSDDAIKMSRELDLTLTERSGFPMCGIPFHSSEPYIKRLVDKGYRIAMCEQIKGNDDNDIHRNKMKFKGEKSTLDREVNRLFTPGTVTEESMLVEERNNFIASFFYTRKDSDNDPSKIGLVFGDLSTGMLHISNVKNESEIIDRIVRFMPSEVLFNNEFVHLKNTNIFLKEQITCCVETLDDESFEIDNELINTSIEDETLAKKISKSNKAALSALSALLNYIKYTQKSDSILFTNIENDSDGKFLEITAAATQSLELDEMTFSAQPRRTLLWVLDKTKTSMGKRRIRELIKRPFAERTIIESRLDFVEKLVHDKEKLYNLNESLLGIYDIERIASRVVYKNATPKDIYLLGVACENIPLLKKVLNKLSSPLAIMFIEMIDGFNDVTNLIKSSITENPPLNINDGGYIKRGYNNEVDRLRVVSEGNGELLKEIELRERKSTGMKTLKIKHNRVYGYYFEVLKSNTPLVPNHYRHKQSLSNHERYVTDELCRIEENMFSAKKRLIDLEKSIFGEIKETIKKLTSKIQRSARYIAEIDVLCSLAEIAANEGYCRPEIIDDDVIDIKCLRHPVIEKSITETKFIPNDCFIGSKLPRFLMITGPNMAGKSTYIRQIGLSVIISQIGGFVPADTAKIGIVDKILTRIGASDNLSMGKSTFAVEMTEVAAILSNATEKSLVILDEIGRGTSALEGLSIAKAIVEYIINKIGCKTLFATHYHELTKLGEINKNIKNLNIKVINNNEHITFTHEVISGAANKSYGIEVAEMSGVPQEVISNAKTILKKFGTMD